MVRERYLHAGRSLAVQPFANVVLFIYLLIYLFTYLFIYLSVYLFIYLFVCLFVCLFVYLFTYFMFVFILLLFYPNRCHSQVSFSNLYYPAQAPQFIL